MDSITPQNFDTVDIKHYTVYTCNNSKSEGSTFDGSSSVNISPMILIFPVTTLSSFFNFDICSCDGLIGPAGTACIGTGIGGWSYKTNKKLFQTERK